MNARIDSIRQQVDGIRKSGKMPHWRMVYADALLTRAQEYMAIDRAPEALRVLDKLDRWVASHTPKEAAGTQADFVPMTFWNAEMLTDVVNRIRKTLSAKGPLIPSTERESINRRLKIVEQWIAEGRFLDAHDELLSMRTALIARLRRSYRARIASTDYRHGSFVQPAGTLVGPYHSRHTLEETFQVIGERDPIWIEDFLDIYNDLFRIVERLVPQDKK